MEKKKKLNFKEALLSRALAIIRPKTLNEFVSYLKIHLTVAFSEKIKNLMIN